MGKRDPRVDTFIGKAAPFARPILTHIRAVVHDACPDVEETLKWGSPAFMYHGILCMMSAFKEHAIFGFWKGTPHRRPRRAGSTTRRWATSAGSPTSSSSPRSGS